jgi:hypothetical protein
MYSGQKSSENRFPEELLNLEAKTAALGLPERNLTTTLGRGFAALHKLILDCL